MASSFDNHLPASVMIGNGCPIYKPHTVCIANSVPSVLHFSAFINPRCMHEGYSRLLLCLCVSVAMLAATYMYLICRWKSKCIRLLMANETCGIS